MMSEKVKSAFARAFSNKVKQKEFEYEEIVKSFTGLIFHCPNCDEVMHLHIATVRVEDK